MKRSTLAAVALAALLVTAGAAAATPGSATQADANEQSSDHATSSAPSDADSADSPQGPPADLPERVPDHVIQIHDLIRQFLSGQLDGPLGESVSDVASGGDSENAADRSG